MNFKLAQSPTQNMILLLHIFKSERKLPLKKKLKTCVENTFNQPSYLRNN